VEPIPNDYLKVIEELIVKAALRQINELANKKTNK
jgi:hypothetical protein